MVFLDDEPMLPSALGLRTGLGRCLEIALAFVFGKAHGCLDESRDEREVHWHVTVPDDDVTVPFACCIVAVTMTGEVDAATQVTLPNVLSGALLTVATEASDVFQVTWVELSTTTVGVGTKQPFGGGF
jgi:hypothetical protein